MRSDLTFTLALPALRKQRGVVSALLLCLVLLQSALPWLAAQAAQAQGVSLVEVCTVYGVRTVSLDTASDEHAPSAATHGDGHCLLQALGFGPAPTAPVATLPPLAATPAIEVLPRATWVADATALWVAQHKHGPPSV